MSVSKSKNEDGDTPFNKSLLYYNSNAENLRSWISASLGAQNSATAAENESEVEELTNEGDEEGGLGYIVPTETLLDNRQSLSANDKLRQQLLGRRVSVGSKRSLSVKGDSLSASKPKPQVKKKSIVDTDEEGEGRTSHTSKASNKKLHARSSETNFSSAQTPNSEHVTSTRSKKRATSYLDEILAQRQTKKTKHQK